MNSRLKKIRLEKGLSQEEFAKRLNVSRSHIAGLESGRKNLTDRFINDVCREYGVNEYWLYNGSGDIFVDPVQGLNIDEDLKEMTRLYLSLDDEMKKTVKLFIESSIKAKDRD